MKEIEIFCDRKFEETWDNGPFTDDQKVNSSNLLKEGYKFIARVVSKEHKELTPVAVNHINILEGFLLTFIQHGYSFKHIRKLEAVIG